METVRTYTVELDHIPNWEFWATALGVVQPPTEFTVEVYFDYTKAEPSTGIPESVGITRAYIGDAPVELPPEVEDLIVEQIWDELDNPVL